MANFVYSFSAVYRVSIPGGYPRRSILLLQASRPGQFLHIAFVRDVDKESGTLVNREPQTRWLFKHSLNFSQCNKYYSAIWRRKKNTNFCRWCFQYHFNLKNTRASSFYHCFTILRSHKRGIIYTRFHTFYFHVNVELYIHVFIHSYGGEKQKC